MLALAPRSGHDIALPGTVLDVSFLGSVIRVHVEIGGTPVHIDTFNEQAARPPGRGDSISVHLASRDLLVLPQ